MHHANLFIGEREAILVHLDCCLTSEGFNQKGNPDYVRYSLDSLGVDDARDIVQRGREKPFGEKRIIVIDARRFTPEAQNALLKILEEPPRTTHFFILAQEESQFLPTVLSRVQSVKIDGEMGETKQAKKFLSLTPAKRLNFAKKFADKEGREKLSQFLDELLLELKQSDASPDKLKSALVPREYSSDPAAMPRLILEHLALAL